MPEPERDPKLKYVTLIEFGFVGQSALIFEMIEVDEEAGDSFEPGLISASYPTRDVITKANGSVITIDPSKYVIRTVRTVTRPRKAGE